jgi:hypothetical protein
MRGQVDASQVKAAMAGVSGLVQDCYSKHKVVGVFKVKVVVAKGVVKTVTVLGTFSGTPTGTCVAAAVMQAKFPADASVTFSYPYTFK